MPGSDAAQRKIIHVDMDAFYAAVEQRDRPELRGKPVIVGGPPQGRGVVSTASYEARVFGVHSAQPCSQAGRLCPQGIFVRPDFPRYVAVSRQIREIFHRYTDLVEPLSLDEAYLDVTVNHLGEPSATRVAEDIRRTIARELGLTASAGVANSKFLAKVASDMDKPDGLTVIPPARVTAFLRDLPVRKIPGIGRVTEERCHERGIFRCGDFLPFTREELVKFFGSAGSWFHDLARGVDPRPVTVEHVRRSCGIEDTFAEDVSARSEAEEILRGLAQRLAHRLDRAGVRGRTVTLKVKYATFQQVTRSRSLDIYAEEAEILASVAIQLLAETRVGIEPVRLLGISVSHLDTETEEEQLHLPFYEEMLRREVLGGED